MIFRSLTISYLCMVLLCISVKVVIAGDETVSVSSQGMITAGAIGVYDPNVPEELRVRKGLSNFFTKVHSGGPVRIAYLGGSITAADGWRPKSLAWFRSQYPDTEFSEINAAISGTGSDYAACRIAQDVLAHGPDLIFMEHRVNGGGGFEAKSVEGIIRQIWRHNPRTDICLVYTISLIMLKEMQANKSPWFGAILERVAQAYGIPSIDFGVEIAKREREGSLIFQARSPVDGKLVFTADGTHPGNEGHDIYCEVLARSMLTMQSGGQEKPHVLINPLDAKCWETATLVPISAVEKSDGWMVVDTQHDPVYRSDPIRTHQMLRGALRCNTAGETVTVSWHGTTIGFSDIPQEPGIEVELSIDDSPPLLMQRIPKDTSRKFARFFYLPEQLSGDHTVTLRVKKIPAGVYYYVGQVLVIGTPRVKR